MAVMVDWYTDEVIGKIDKAAAKDAERSAHLVARTARHTKLFKDVSGALRKNIRVVKSKFKGGGYLVVAGGKGPWGDAWYAAQVHLGHRIGKTGRHASPKPFLWRALDVNRKLIKAVFKNR